MYVFVIADLRKYQQRIWRLFGALFIVVFIAGLLVLANYLTWPSNVWTVSQFSQAIEQGQIKRLVIYGDHTVIDTTEGAQFYLAHGARSIIELLRGQGISKDSLDNVEIIVMPGIPIEFVTWLTKNLWIIFIVLLFSSYALVRYFIKP